MMATMDKGRVIILNGTASAGKTTVGRMLQAVMDGPWLLAGGDSFRAMMSPRWVESGARAHEGFAWTKVASDEVPGTASGREPVVRITAGPVGQRVMAGMRRAVRAMADAGNDVIVDDLFLDPAWLLDWARVLHGIDAWLVGIRCPAAVLRQRERLRGTRPAGEAVGQLAVVHAHGDYDIEVDTSLATPERCAGRIVDHVARHRPRALTRIHDSRSPTL
jgi:chloramphenicol 3-O phosphotransferase